MTPITKPLTPEEIDRRMDRNGNIRVVVPISLGEIIHRDIEGLNDLMEEKILGEGGLLSDIRYDISGYTFNGVNQDGNPAEKLLLLEVQAQIVFNNDSDEW